MMSITTAVRREEQESIYSGGRYYVCPSCGFKQLSQARKQIRCHRCRSTYKRRTAKRADKRPDGEKGMEFFQYSRG